MGSCMCSPSSTWCVGSWRHALFCQLSSREIFPCRAGEFGSRWWIRLSFRSSCHRTDEIVVRDPQSNEDIVGRFSRTLFNGQFSFSYRSVNLQRSKGHRFTPCFSTTIILSKNFSAFALWLSTKRGVKCVPQWKISLKCSQSSVSKSRAC